MDPKELAKAILQQQEREQQAELFTTAEMHKKGASDRSVRIALTGLYTLPGCPCLNCPKCPNQSGNLQPRTGAASCARYLQRARSSYLNCPKCPNQSSSTRPRT